MVILSVALGCGALREPTAVSYDTILPEGAGGSNTAKELNRSGLIAFEAGRLPEAERLFRNALKADSSFGPAHNNLGQIYLARHQLYLAAWEFEYASNLMPELVEPIINQGLAYETGERLTKAADLYQQACDQDSTHPIAIASLARTRIKMDGDPQAIAFLLDELIMHDGRQAWVEWAKELRATRYRNQLGNCSVDSETLGDVEFHGLSRHDVSSSTNKWNAETPTLNSPVTIGPAPVAGDSNPQMNLVPAPIQDIGPEVQKSPTESGILLPPPPQEPTPLNDLTQSLKRPQPKRIGMRTSGPQISDHFNRVQQATFLHPTSAR